MNRTIATGLVVALVAAAGIVVFVAAPGSVMAGTSLDGQAAQAGPADPGAGESTDATGASQQSAGTSLSLEAPPNRTAIDSTVVQLQVPERDGVSYDWTQTSGPDATLMADDSATPWLVTPDVHSSRTMTFEVTVANGDRTETATTDITVHPNDAPTGAIDGPLQVTEDDSFLLDGTSSGDSDGDSIRYEWHQTAGPDAELGPTNGSTLAVTAPRVSEPTPIRFELVVTDSHAQRNTVTRDVTVYPSDSGTDGQQYTEELLVNDDSTNLSQRGLTHYQVDLVEGEPLAELGAQNGDGFYSDQERLVQWLWGDVDDRVTERGRPATLDEETDDCVESESIDVDGETATVDVTVSDGCAVELSLVTYVKSEPGFERATASEQVLYDTTTATVGPGTYTFSVAVPADE